MARKKVLIYLLLIGAVPWAFAQAPKDLVESMIAEAGFKSEIYDVETKDGYILTIHRILKKSNTKRAGPVFMMHPLITTSADYIRTGPEIGLPYLLSENGYDIWLGNSRGNDYGLRHKTLSPDSKEFWDFSWHEIGYYDVPAMFDFMLNKTRSSRGYYVGYSQGGTSFFVANSMHPELNKKIIQSHLMAPAAFLNYAVWFIPHQPGSVLLSGVLAAAEAVAGNSMTGYGVQITNESDSISEKLCGIAFGVDFSKVFCQHFLSGICGGNRNGPEGDPRVMAKGFERLTHSVSIKQIFHYFQSYIRQKFSQYDYGAKNMEIYNSSEPPDYPLKNIKTPVFLYGGLCDILVAEGDLDLVSGLLPNVKKYKKIDNYNHCDFSVGKNSRSILFNEILQAMNAPGSKGLKSQSTRVKWNLDGILADLGRKMGWS